MSNDLPIEVRCEIHAEKMQGEGWYVTANVLSAAAETIRGLRKDLKETTDSLRGALHCDLDDEDEQTA